MRERNKNLGDHDRIELLEDCIDDLWAQISDQEVEHGKEVADAKEYASRNRALLATAVGSLLVTAIGLIGNLIAHH